MTGTELVSACLGHIGNRSVGQIGPETVQVSAMNSINKALLYVAKRFDTLDLERDVTISVTSSDYSYSRPVLDTSGNTIRIKSCEVARLKETGETTGRVLKVVPMQIFDRTFVIMDSSRNGRPTTMAAWNTTVKLYPWPDTTYTLYIKANIWPTLFTVATLANNSPFGAEWDAVVIDYATGDLFAKLQQPKDATSWMGMMHMELKTTRGALSKNNTMHMDATMRDIVDYNTDISGYGQDPFVMNNLILN